MGALLASALARSTKTPSALLWQRSRTRLLTPALNEVTLRCAARASMAQVRFHGLAERARANQTGHAWQELSDLAKSDVGLETGDTDQIQA